MYSRLRTQSTVFMCVLQYRGVLEEEKTYDGKPRNNSLLARPSPTPRRTCSATLDPETEIRRSEGGLWPRELSNTRTQSHNSPLFWPCSGGTGSLPTSGPHSHSPTSTKDSRHTHSEFTWTLRSLHPPPPPSYALMVCCTSWHLKIVLSCVAGNVLT